MAWKDLPREEKIKRWEETEQKVLALLAVIDGLISENDRRNAVRFVDANEFGLAFEQLVFAVREQERPITSKQFSEIESAYRFFKSALVDVDDSMIADIKSLVRE